MDAARQQIVDSIKADSNILVTVSTDPSVDELSAALGLTILLNKMDKRATAVVSGNIPPAINFLEPDKTFESTADSLRDFIIALDKEKADHLRYKVDGDVVKIFITPYKTTLSQDDLDFSQGDYNVELVVAIGVKDQDHLDKALSAHGKILHDATVVTVTNGEETSSLGATDWHDAAASSLSEMIVSLADGLKGDKTLLDEQIASAFLTGIVSATDRFSNDRTSSRVMTMAAQLMAAGANQQLIAAKLEEAHDIAPEPLDVSDSTEGKSEDKKEQADATELTIDRSDKSDDVVEQDGESKPDEAPAVAEVTSLDDVQKQLEEQLGGLAQPAPSMADIEKDLEQEAASEAAVVPSEVPQPQDDTGIAPLTTVSDSSMPGFEAPEVPVAPLPPPPEPIEQAQLTPPEAPAAESQMVIPPMPPIPEIINQHGSFTTEPPASEQALNSVGTDPNEGAPSAANPFTISEAPEQPAAEVQNIVPPLTPPLPEVPAPGAGTPEGAAMLGADMPAPAAAPVVPEAPVAPAADSIPSLPPLPPLPPLPTDGSLPPLPPPPPMPEFGQTPQPLSGAVTGDVFGDASAAQTPAAPAPAPEPGQFRIPGQ